MFATSFFKQPLAALAAFLLLAAPGTASAQRTDAENREKIEAPEVPDDSGKRPDLAKVAQLATERTNAFRKQEGRGPVAANKELAAAAGYFANYMAKNDEYGHGADGKRPAERAKEHGYDYCIVLENIAYAFDSRGFDAEPLAEKFFVGWRESPGHRKNMLDPDVTDTGVAIARSETTGYYYAVQMFGRPKSKAIEFKVTNKADAAVSYVIGEEKFTLEPRYTRGHTRCRPPELVLTLPARDPDAKPETQTLRPANGEHFVITKGDDGYAVKKE